MREPKAIDEVVLGYARLSTSKAVAKEIVSIEWLASWTFDGVSTRMRWQNQWVKEEKVRWAVDKLDESEMKLLTRRRCVGGQEGMVFRAF
jgi:hypothetical protein